MDVQQRMKELVAHEAASRIESGMILGLGSGSTAALMIEALGRRLGEFLRQRLAGAEIAALTQLFRPELVARQPDRLGDTPLQ